MRKKVSVDEKELVERMARRQEYLISKLKDKELDTLKNDCSSKYISIKEQFLKAEKLLFFYCPNGYAKNAN